MKGLKEKEWLYLCTQMDCKHFMEEFTIRSEHPIRPYVDCPLCGYSAEWTGSDMRLIDHIVF